MTLQSETVADLVSAGFELTSLAATDTIVVERAGVLYGVDLANSSTSLVAIGLPAYIQTFLAATSAVEARAVLSASPLLKTTEGPGQVLAIDNGVSGGLRIPGNVNGGETWFYFAIKLDASGGVSDFRVGVGESFTALDGGTPGQKWIGFGIRLA